MRILIVDDHFANRLVLQAALSPYGQCHVAVNGVEAVDAVDAALDAGEPYDLICMDILMPEMDGHRATARIRGEEEARGIPWEQRSRIVMVTAVDSIRQVMASFRNLCDAYLTKPIEPATVHAELAKLGFAPTAGRASRVSA